MKDLKFNKELLGYAVSFVGFALPKLMNIKEVFLFGSVARAEADGKSDVDLFFNILSKTTEKNIEKEIKDILEDFYKSKIAEIWRLKGITNELKINVGILEEWKLKRSIISEGIVLYGKYKSVPEKMQGYTIFNLVPIKNITKRNNIIRKLFGRKEKKYISNGFLDEIRGKKQSPSSFIVPIEVVSKTIKFLNENKVNYKLLEFWTDQVVS